MDAEYIVAEGEHSQFEIVKHACAVGSRVFVGSSGVGWFYAFEAIAVTAGLRLPVVAICGNRALDDPGAFGTEHNDSLAVRDLGWLLPWAETAQEALDLALMAWRVGEDKRVSLPVAIGLDGAFLTHSQHMVQVPTTEAVKRFLPRFDLGKRVLHPDNPISIAPQVNEDWVMELRRQNWEAARRAKPVIAQAYQEFNKIFGERYTSPYFTEFMTDDADFVLVGLGAVAMPARTAVRRLRDQGHKVGYVGLRWFRPFPTTELRECLGKFKGVGIIDRDCAHGAPDSGGILFHDMRSCLYPLKKRPVMSNFIGGLGGRDISIDDCIRMFDLTKHSADKGVEDVSVTWIGLRE
jgi:pyruvate ferredoxin oxidoreductase alpha subunit